MSVNQKEGGFERSCNIVVTGEDSEGGRILREGGTENPRACVDQKKRVADKEEHVKVPKLWKKVKDLPLHRVSRKESREGRDE